MQTQLIIRFMTAFMVGMVALEVTMRLFWDTSLESPEVFAPRPDSSNHGSQAFREGFNHSLAHSSEAPKESPDNYETAFLRGDLWNGTLMVSENQTLSCFPETDDGWSASSCGIVVDGFSQRTSMDQASYHRFVQMLMQDILVSSSGHLPYFDPFPRIVIVHSDGGDAATTHGNRVQVAEVAMPLRTLRRDGIRRSVRWAKGSRVLVVVTVTAEKSTNDDVGSHTASGVGRAALGVQPFDVMQWTPFDRTIFVNGSFGIPKRRKVAPPTLLLPLLDHYQLLLAPIPYMEEALLKLQRASCWPLEQDRRILMPAEQFYVGAMYHSGFALYRRCTAVWRAFSIASDLLRGGLRLDGTPSTSNLCTSDILSDDLFRRSFALSTALRTLSATADGQVLHHDPALSAESLDGAVPPSIALIDPIHCADLRYGLDPCNRITNRPSKKQKKEKFETFRCDKF